MQQISSIGLFKGIDNTTPLNYISTSSNNTITSISLTSIVSASDNDTFRSRVSQINLTQFTCKFVSTSAYAI